MESPIKDLKNRLAALKLLSMQKGFSAKKKEAKKLILDYEKAISILENAQVEKASNDLYALLVSRLNRLKEIGYHTRFSGSIFIIDKKVPCDCCGLPTRTKIGYEKDYPKNPDMGLCPKCSELLADLYGN